MHSKMHRNGMLPRPHTMATESDLNQRRVVPVLGAQFRSRASTPDPIGQVGATCPGCAALNSKLQRLKTDTAEIKRREKEAGMLAERCIARERELEEGWRAHQQGIGAELERVRREAADALLREREATEVAEARATRLQRALERVRQEQAAQSPRDPAKEPQPSPPAKRPPPPAADEVADLQRRLAAAEERAGVAEAGCATLAEGKERGEEAQRRQLVMSQALRSELAHAEAEAAAAARDATARLEGSQSQLVEARAAARSAAAGGEEAARQVARLEAEQAAALEAAQAAQQARVEQLGAQLQEERRAAQARAAETDGARRRLAELEAEVRSLADRLQAANARAEAAEAAVHAARRAGDEAAQAEQQERGARRSSQAAQQAAELAQAAAQAQRDQAIEELARQKVQLRQVETARREMEQREEAQSQLNLREMLGAIKIAVLAPCIRVNVAGGEALQAGSAAQVDFAHMRGLLEEKVLSRWSSVKLLGDAVDLAEGGAYAIFPELRDAMGLIQKEVTERLLVMMQEAQQQPAPDAAAAAPRRASRGASRGGL